MLATATAVLAQKKVYTYYLNAQMESVPKEKALIIAKGHTLDSSYLMRYYRLPGNDLLAIEHYKDSGLTLLHGHRILYHANKHVKEKTKYENNRLSGLMLQWDSIGNLTDSSLYKDDQLLFGIKKKYNKNQWPYNILETDSLNNTMRDIDCDSLGNKYREIFFVGSKGTWTEYKKDGTVESVDSVFTRESKEAKFPTQNGGWRGFLEKNLNGMVPIIKGAEPGQGTVIIQFIVETDGTLSNMKPLTNIGFGAEEEVLRILKKSPKWIPASRYGKAVKAYRKQPVTFSIAG